MNDLQSRIKDYLDRKKPDRVQVMTDDVKSTDSPDPESWNQFKSDMAKIKSAPVVIAIIFSVCYLAWVGWVIDSQNKCYKDKECREWVQNK